MDSMDKDFFNESKRVYFKGDRLFYWISKAVDICGGQRRLSKKIRVEQNNIHGYLHQKTKSIRGDILKKICGIFSSRQQQRITQDIYNVTGSRDYGRRTISKARESLLKKYRPNAYKYIQSKSKESLKRMYGEDYMKVLSKRGTKKLIEKYGDDAHKIITQRGFETMKEKYGNDFVKIMSSKGQKSQEIKYRKEFDENWRSTLGKICHQKRIKKYGKDYLRKQVANVHKSLPLTEQERRMAKLLSDKKIAHVTHAIIEDYIECDILIPDSENPKICVELTKSTPQPSNLYRKIAQIASRKRKLLGSKFIFVTPEKKKTSRQVWYARPDLIKFLLEENVLVFWDWELDKVALCIQKLLRNESITHFIEEKISWCEKKISERKKWSKINAIYETKRVPHSEKKIIKQLQLKGRKTILENKYGWPITADLVNGSNVFEITTGKIHSALECITGKIFYLNKTLDPSLNLNLVTTVKKDYPSKELLDGICNHIVVQDHPTTHTHPISLSHS